MIASISILNFLMKKKLSNIYVKAMTNRLNMTAAGSKITMSIDI